MDKLLLIDENRGLYIPQQFVKTYGPNVMGYNPQSIDDLNEDLNICLYGPDHDLYSEAWSQLLATAKLTIEGKQYTLEQDGDLWAVPVKE